MNRLLVVALLTIFSARAYAQFDPDYKKSKNYKAREEYKDPVDYEEPLPIGNFGLGIGLDYGGVGLHFEFLPLKTLGLFGSVGYNLNGAGYNFGANFRILPKARVSPTLIGMYGYNAVIVVEGASNFNKTYFGPTFGAGVNFRSSRNNDFFSAELLIPSRSDNYHNDINALQNNPSIDITPAWPIAISLGYHFSF